MISMEHAILLQLDIPLMLDIVFRIPTANSPYLYWNVDLDVYTYHVESDGYVDHRGSWNVTGSYGMIYTTNKKLAFALRIIITAILQILCTRMVSSMAFGRYQIPTEIYQFLTK